jgi:hypothetical protein
MNNKGTTNAEEIKIQGLLDNYLRLNKKNSNSGSKQHLDDDMLTAFVEGNLSQREQKPIISHLVDCSFCRNITSELVKLDFAFAENDVTVSNLDTQPTKVSEVLSGIFSRLFGTSDGAVFAHQESEKDEEEDKEKEDSEK